MLVTPRGAHCLPISPSLELRYSISAVADSKDRYAGGYYNSARFYLYSSALKKKVGREWLRSFKFTKKEIAKAKGTKPDVSDLSNSEIQIAFATLMDLNCDLPSDYKKTKKSTARVHLNDNELVVFWLTHFSKIYALVPSTASPSDLNKRMAKVFSNEKIASFDLSSLKTVLRDDLEQACTSLVNQVKKTITDRSDIRTVGVNKTVQLIRYAVSCYLTEQSIDPSLALKILIRESRVKAGIESKVATAMRLKSMPIERYRELWSRLTEINNAENAALLCMIFLGLRAEEICGLQHDDYCSIPDRLGFYQLRITHMYSKIQKHEYGLEVLDEDSACRNIPLPFQIRIILKECFAHNLRESGYLFQVKGKPLNPDKLKEKLYNLLDTPSNIIEIIDEKGRPKSVNVAFHARNYRESCRYYWQHHCGLTEGEICYLSSLSPPDTAARHYIDFNNGSMQYRMLKQMEYGLALFANPDREYPERREWSKAPDKAFYSSGRLNKRASMDLHISEPVEIEISSNRGILVYMEGTRK